MLAYVWWKATLHQAIWEVISVSWLALSMWRIKRVTEPVKCTSKRRDCNACALFSVWTVLDEKMLTWSTVTKSTALPCFFSMVYFAIALLAMSAADPHPVSKPHGSNLLSCIINDKWLPSALMIWCVLHEQVSMMRSQLRHGWLSFSAG